MKRWATCACSFTLIAAELVVIPQAGGRMFASQAQRLMRRAHSETLGA